MGKQQERSDKTRQALIDAFCILYSCKPLEKITVQEIARKAGYNRSTFYQYFLDVDDLRSYVEQELLDYIYENREGAETLTRSDSFIRSLVALYEAKSLYIDALLGEYGSNRLIERIKLDSKFDIPEFNLPDNDRYKPYYIEYHLSTTISLFRLWLQRGRDLPVADFMTLTATLFNKGMSSFDMVCGTSK